MGEQATAQLGEITTCFAVTYEREVPHPPSRLWWALTDAGALANWWHCPARIDLRVGGEWFVDFTQTSEVLPGVIVALEPERLLRVAWNLSVMQWTIEPTEIGCRYSFVHQGNRLEEPDSASYEPAAFLAGWHAGLDEIAHLLDGAERTSDDDHGTYGSVLPAYRAMFTSHFGLN